MKLRLALFAEPVLAMARRLFWLSLWLVWLPTVVYVFWLNQGHNLALIQGTLFLISIVGLTMINAETAVVFYHYYLRHCPRGLLQRWLRTGHNRLHPSTSLPLPLPFVSVVVVAYLPNEQNIIEETLVHWLTQVETPAAGWELILAYNTPVALPVEGQLRQLADHYPTLILLPVSQSQSKAENLNAALRQVRGEMTCIFDADHHPPPSCFNLAWRWLAQGDYDGVQGRNIIRNARDNTLTQLISIEFECNYGITHYGRSLLADTAIFGGSNGYWRTSALRSLRFYASRLTEDIDATVRGLLRGYRLVHDPAIITTELAPTTLQGLWLQRQRWSQGWLEVAWLYTDRMRRSAHLDPVQKAYWMLMLIFSQCFYPLVWQAVPMMIGIHWSGSDRDLAFENLNLAMMVLLSFSTVLQVNLAIRLRPQECNYSRRHGWLYCLLSPAYFWLKVIVGMVAIYNHLSGSRVWHVTARPSDTLALSLQSSEHPYPVKSR